MTQEEKAKAYDEALKKAREIKEKIMYSHLSTESCKAVSEYIDTIIPELHESEDEKIREALLEYFGKQCDTATYNGIYCYEIYAWLERQKDASKAIEAVDRIDKYIDEHLANAHDMKDSNPDKKYYRGWDDALGAMAGILQDVYSGEKQKESLRDFIDDFPYSDEQKEHHYTKRNALFDKCVENCDPEVMKEVSDKVDEMLENEEVMKAIEDVIRVYGKTQGEWIAGYDIDTLVVHLRKAFAALEKQKENPKSADSIPSDCTSDAKCEDRWHKVGDSLPNNPREVLCKDEAGNYFIGRYYTDEGWEISNYDDEDKPHHLNPPVSKWIDFPSEKQKEQKPEGVYVDCTEHPEWYGMPAKEQKPKAKAKSPLSPHELYDAKIEGITQGRQDVLDHPEQFGLQKPAEWSEEDESFLDSIEEAIHSYYDLNHAPQYDYWLEEKLKSLRPQYHGDVTMTEAYKMGKEAGEASHWKPSEVQMEALNKAIPVCMGVVGQDAVAPLESLWEQLEKLI